MLVVKGRTPFATLAVAVVAVAAVPIAITRTTWNRKPKGFGCCLLSLCALRARDVHTEPPRPPYARLPCCEKIMNGVHRGVCILTNPIN